MGLEIERKFLLKDESWRPAVSETMEIKQGYLNSAIERTVRVRLTGNKGVLTIKGKTVNLTREEFEYEIPIADARRLMKLCETPIIEKLRHLVRLDGRTWEIDEFSGVNESLVVAEIELNSEDEDLALPEWVGREVSDDPRYYNASLIAHPFSEWKRS